MGTADIHGQLSGSLYKNRPFLLLKEVTTNFLRQDDFPISLENHLSGVYSNGFAG